MEQNNLNLINSINLVSGVSNTPSIPTPDFSLTNSKYNYTARRDDYLTPHSFIQRVLKEENLPYFDCDVCSSLYNIPALIYGKKMGSLFFWMDTKKPKFKKKMD